MRTTSTKKKPFVLVAAAAVVLLAAVGAFAYWTAGGGGTGEAETGSSEALVVNQTTVLDPMGPGVAAQTLTGNFTNTNDGPSYVGSVDVVVSGTNQAGCDATDYTITGASMDVTDEVPAGTAQGSWTGATIAFNNLPDTNQDACQGATVNLTYTIVDAAN